MSLEAMALAGGCRLVSLGGHLIVKGYGDLSITIGSLAPALQGGRIEGIANRDRD